MLGLLAIGLMVALGLAVAAALGAGKNPWDLFFVNPLINALVLIDAIVWGQLGLAIIALTLALRLVSTPLTLRQLRSTRKIQAFSPEQREISKSIKDPLKRQQALGDLYRRAGVNPLGSLAPLAIQMLVFIALNRALRFLASDSPENLIGLSGRLYHWSLLSSQLPLNESFLWLNLGSPDPTYILPVLVGLSTYGQRLLMPAPMSQDQRRTQQVVMWLMPLFMAWITTSLASGVSLYWVTSSVTALLVNKALASKLGAEPAIDSSEGASSQMGGDLSVRRHTSSARGTSLR